MAPVWLDWLSTISTTVAAVLAFLAIRQATRQAEESARLTRQERRIDWELDLLKDLAQQAAYDTYVSTKMRDGRLALRLLGAHRLPVCRAGFSMPSTEEAESLRAKRVEERQAQLGGLGAAPDEALRADMDEEIDAEIERLLALREATKYHAGITARFWPRMQRRTPQDLEGAS